MVRGYKIARNELFKFRILILFLVLINDGQQLKIFYNRLLSWKYVFLEKRLTIVKVYKKSYYHVNAYQENTRDDSKALETLFTSNVWLLICERRHRLRFLKMHFLDVWKNFIETFILKFTCSRVSGQFLGIAVRMSFTKDNFLEIS